MCIVIYQLIAWISFWFLEPLYNYWQPPFQEQSKQSLILLKECVYINRICKFYYFFKFVNRKSIKNIQEKVSKSPTLIGPKWEKTKNRAHSAETCAILCSHMPLGPKKKHAWISQCNRVIENGKILKIEFQWMSYIPPVKG